MSKTILILLLPLPLTLKAGLLDADLKVLFPPNNQPLGLEGTVRLQNVTAIVQDALEQSQKGQINWIPRDRRLVSNQNLSS